MGERTEVYKNIKLEAFAWNGSRFDAPFIYEALGVIFGPRVYE